MRKGAYERMLDGLASLSVPEGAKRQFEELIRQSAARDGIGPLDRSERVRFARRLLDQKEPRATISKAPAGEVRDWPLTSLPGDFRRAPTVRFFAR